ncbi:hypothetical protein [Nafulsella turpanensis]|uniref:hypothetical protein n=1 Tax=Nafulsella turpanensis TaxID=1265690 RepID=UPI00034C1A59|nr:hypothetical protein [Nafulsella turpanensis]
MSKTYSENLNTVLETREKLKAAKATDIKFSDPVIKQNENAVIFPHTINIIQGQAGVHKSRLAECICVSLLKLPSCNQAKGLVLADASETADLSKGRKKKADVNRIIEYLEIYLGNGSTITRIKSLQEKIFTFYTAPHLLDENFISGSVFTTHSDLVPFFLRISVKVSLVNHRTGATVLH